MLEAAKYLKEYIDENVAYTDWNKEAKKRLSIQLSGAFDFYLAELLDTKILFLKPVDSYTPAQMEKWGGLIEEKTGFPAVFLLNQITPYMTRKFLMDHVGFIVPDKQISLPFLATHIRNEKVREVKNIRKFSPKVQLTFIYILYGKSEEYTLDEVAEALQISMMSATRAMRDLTDLGLLSCTVAGTTGRKKIFKRISQREYYLTGREYLDVPVRDTIYVRELPKGLNLPKADLCALGEKTMLGEMKQPCYAIQSKERGKLSGLEVSREQAMEENLPIIQLTKYDVGITSGGEYEDPVSLILGLSERDDRIDMAIDELMENMEWFEE